MKKVPLYLVIGFLAAVLSGCFGGGECPEITIEAGDHELLEVLCSHEGIRRIGDPEYLINITNDDNWDPFHAGESYAVDYEKVSLKDNKSENKTICIAITDTTPPVILRKPGSFAAVVPYSEDPEVMERSISEMIAGAFVVDDNSSATPMPISGENLTISEFDSTLLEEPQLISFHISDPSGNWAEASIKVTIHRT
ncbi:MAG: hypothetical protein SOZ47_07945 [Lawsonibacter sp.]|nr:hypothetical protein [Lawsonibacter sp.]